MDKPTIAQRKPIIQRIEPGAYWWCTAVGQLVNLSVTVRTRVHHLVPRKLRSPRLKPSRGAPVSIPVINLFAMAPTLVWAMSE